MPMKWSLVTPPAQNWETETRVLSPSAKLQRAEAALLCWCHGGAKCRGDCDGCADRFNAGKTLGASSTRARSTRVEDGHVGDVERVESLMQGLDDECVELGVGGTAG